MLRGVLRPGKALYGLPIAILMLFGSDLACSQHVEVDPRGFDSHPPTDQLSRPPAEYQANVQPPASASITSQNQFAAIVVEPAGFIVMGADGQRTFHSCWDWVRLRETESGMCNRARFAGEPDTLFGSTGKLFDERPRDNRFNPQELRPKGRAYVIREQDGERAWDVMSWDVLGGQAAWPMTNVRNLKLPQWRKLAAEPKNRCIVPLTEFCEWTPDKHDLGDGKPPIKGEMWFQVTDQPTFAVAGFWQHTAEGDGFTMVTCDPNELVAPIHPKAMITILRPDHVDELLPVSWTPR